MESEDITGLQGGVRFFTRPHFSLLCIVAVFLLALIGPVIAAVPVVTSVSPSSGHVYAEATIRGAGFSGATDVYFGSVRSLSWGEFMSDTEITCQVPDGSGTVDVTVITPEGTSAVSVADKFTYIPVIKKISPVLGSSAGGTSVVITGTSLGDITGVMFGSTPAAGFTIESNQVITAITPPGTGSVAVTVTGPGGSASTGTGGYTFLSGTGPTVTSVSPSSGTAYSEVTLTGTGFTGATDIYFGGVRDPYGWRVVSDNVIRVNVPEGTGTVDVTVRAPEGTSAVSGADKFTYLPPVIEEIDPAYGSPSGGTLVYIDGSGMSGITGVTFGSTPAAGFTIESDRVIRAISPPGTGPVAVTVTGPDGSWSTSETGDYFLYEVPPAVTGITPSHGPAGSYVTITGSGLLGTTDIYFGSVRDPHAWSVQSDNEIYCPVIPDGTGTVDVTVVSPEGTSAVSGADKFTYTPVINQITPLYGSSAGGTPVVITGTSLGDISGVTFGSTPAAGFTIESNQVIRAISPPGIGLVAVTVTGPSGSATSSTSWNDFLYEVAPTVSGVSPSHSPVGSVMTITGTGFLGSTDVYFGSVRATDWWVVSDNQIDGQVPDGVGTVDVTVRTPEGTSAVTPADRYTYESGVKPVPEFPAPVLPVTFIIAFLGVVLLVKRTRQN